MTKRTNQDRLDDIETRLASLESHAERQSALNLLLMDHLKRVVREKETLLMHLGLTHLANTAPDLTESERRLARKSNELAKKIAAQMKASGI